MQEMMGRSFTPYEHAKQLQLLFKVQGMDAILKDVERQLNRGLQNQGLSEEDKSNLMVLIQQIHKPTGSAFRDRKLRFGGFTDVERIILDTFVAALEKKLGITILPRDSSSTNARFSRVVDDLKKKRIDIKANTILKLDRALHIHTISNLDRALHEYAHANVEKRIGHSRYIPTNLLEQYINIGWLNKKRLQDRQTHLNKERRQDRQMHLYKQRPQDREIYLAEQALRSLAKNAMMNANNIDRITKELEASAKAEHDENSLQNQIRRKKQAEEENQIRREKQAKEEKQIQSQNQAQQRAIGREKQAQAQCEADCRRKCSGG